MNNFIFSYPTKVYFGKDSMEKALQIELQKCGKNVMLAYGGGSIKRNGIYNKIVNLLKENKKNITDFSGIMPNPTYEKVQEGATLARLNNIDFILAVGGGSVIDCCKIISAQAILEEDIFELEYTKNIYPTNGIPMGTVVTVSGTGSEMNSGAVITFNDKKLKTSLFRMQATFAVLDSEHTLTVPKNQVFFGCI